MPQRACDRCHSIRARCQFNGDEAECERCLRLGHLCTSLRKEKRPGRPRKNTHAKDNTNSNRPSSNETETLENLDPWEVQMAVNFLRSQRFENSFVSDSDLSSPMQSIPIRLFLSAPGRIKDALLALAGVLASQGNATAIANADAVANMERCCKAMERMRESDVSSIDDAKATLFVATSLISVNDMTLGHGFLPVARAALLSIKPWYHQLANAAPAEIDPHLIPVLFAEVSECIRCREVPTLRYDPPSTHSIDPSYGIAQAMLPLLYNICLIRHDLNAGRVSILDASAMAAQTFDEAQQCDFVVLLFQAVSRNPNARLSETQREKVIKHAECYRVMVELLLFQLQLNFTSLATSTADIARRLRDQIVTISTEHEAQIQYLLFPYFVACTELQDAEAQGQVLQRMQDLSGGIATQSCNRMFEFLQYVWAIRSVDPTLCWLDLVEDGVQFSIGP